MIDKNLVILAFRENMAMNNKAKVALAYQTVSKRLGTISVEDNLSNGEIMNVIISMLAAHLATMGPDYCDEVLIGVVDMLMMQIPMFRKALGK